MFRESRNLEASLIDRITSALVEDNWTGIRVEKSFMKAEKGTFPCILVNLNRQTSTRKEIGSSDRLKYYTVDIRIFHTNDGGREDLADWLVDEVLSEDIDYTEHDIIAGAVGYNVKNGKINILEFLSNGKEFINTENLETEDKYRHLISFRCRIARAS